MWESLLRHAALILGIGLSVYTIYEAIDKHVTQARARRALFEELRLEFDVYFRLTSVLQGKGNRFYDKFPEAKGKKYADLSESERTEIDAIVVRVDQVLSMKPHWDLPRIAAFLSAKQMDALIDLLDDYLLYRGRLELRKQEFLADRDRHSAWGRFLASTALEDVKLSEKFSVLRGALGIKAQ